MKTENGSPVILLWRCGWGRISSKPVKTIDLGEGKIKVVGSCRINQMRDDFNESYHDTYGEALDRLLANANRSFNQAKKRLESERRSLSRVKQKWADYGASFGLLK